MDVHTTYYTLCAMEPVIGEEDLVFAMIKVTPDYKNIITFIENLKQKLGLNNDYDVQCGYEAGCLGYSLYNQLTYAWVKCVILAPTTMLTQQGMKIKTDTRDAHMIVLGNAFVISIGTEFIENENEGVSKNDYESKAFKRLAKKLKREYPRLNVCVLADSLYLLSV